LSFYDVDALACLSLRRRDGGGRPRGGANNPAARKLNADDLHWFMFC
jgi:hypothetical protein